MTTVPHDPSEEPCPSVTVVSGPLAFHEGPLTVHLTGTGSSTGDGNLAVMFLLDDPGSAALSTPTSGGQAFATATLPAVPGCGR